MSLFISPLLAILALLLGEGGEYIKCNACAEKVKAEAKVCKHCGATLNPISDRQKQHELEEIKQLSLISKDTENSNNDVPEMKQLAKDPEKEINHNLASELKKGRKKVGFSKIGGACEICNDSITGQTISNHFVCSDCRSRYV